MTHYWKQRLIALLMCISMFFSVQSPVFAEELPDVPVSMNDAGMEESVSSETEEMLSDGPDLESVSDQGVQSADCMTESMENAEETELSEEPAVETLNWINPLYQDILEESDLKEDSSIDLPSSSHGLLRKAALAYTSAEQAGVVVREAMKLRQETVTLSYQSSECSTADGRKTAVASILQNAYAHTGVPTEGDYLRWQFAGFHAKWIYSGTPTISITYTITYYTTAEQESEVTSEVQNVLSGLDLDSKTDYEKIKSIYRYVCDHVDYDTAHLGNQDYKLQYTAYGALIDHQSLCQGYAVLLYRLMLEAGIDCRIITSASHAWNLVKLCDCYYNIDATNDRNALTDFYRYFLLSDEEIQSKGSIYNREAACSGTDFYASYPIGLLSVDPAEEADCTHDGRTEGLHCAICGKILISQETVSGNHQYGNWQTLKKATAASSGKKIRTCSVCHQTQTETIPKLILSVSSYFGRKYSSGDFNLNVKNTGDGTLTYSSSNQKVVTVDSSGRVHLVGVGKATVQIKSSSTASYASAVKTITVKVLKGTQKLTVPQNSYSLQMGEASAAIGAATSGNGKITYCSSNSKVVSVSSEGILTPKAAGTATITIRTAATSRYYSAEKKITVKVVKKVQKLTLQQNSYTLQKGTASTALNAVTSGNGKITYCSSNSKVVSVSSNGILTPKKAGTAVITIRASSTSCYYSTVKKVTVRVY